MAALAELAMRLSVMALLLGAGESILCLGKFNSAFSSVIIFFQSFLLFVQSLNPLVDDFAHSIAPNLEVVIGFVI